MNKICKYDEVLFLWLFYLVWQNRFIAMNSLISWLGGYPDVHNNQLNKWILWNFQKPKRLEVIETISCCSEQKQTPMFWRWPHGREWQEVFRGWMSQSYRCKDLNSAKKLVGKYKFWAIDGVAVLGQHWFQPGKTQSRRTS